MGIPGPMTRAGEGVDIQGPMSGGMSQVRCPGGRGAVYATMWPIRSEDVPNLPQTSFVAGRNNFFELICFHLFVAGGVGKSALTIQLIQNQ